jgi:soluble lytic murein transglycosylase-like protein
MRRSSPRRSARSALALFLGTATLGLGWCGPGYAQVRTYVRTDGVVHLTNVNSVRSTRAVVSDAGEPYRHLVHDAAREYGVHRSLIHAVILAESGYRADAVSHKGAVGLMQLMPDTARRYGVEDPLDPAQNIRGGARYLRDLLRMFRNDVGLAVAAYNAGEGNVLRHGGIPPFPETAQYVLRVLHHYRP